MKIVIDNLQSQDVLSQIDPAAGKNIMGGDSLNASVDISAYSDNATSQAGARVSGSGSNLFATFTVNAQTGKDYSLGNSFSFISSDF
jgi:4-diphosphocytidyl-2C-methyl-D-erythritol kinase